MRDRHGERKDPTAHRERVAVAMVGHVDHGKSTILGRLLAEAGALPRGKLEQVQEYCRRHARVFEYAYLLDALKDEQAQGITIDSARVFFSLEGRDFVCIDAPGHVEFIKNMVTGASRADAAFLVIDVREGVQENSRRHGYLLSFLGVDQVVVLVNKMDLVGWEEEAFSTVRERFGEFLEGLGMRAAAYIPVSGREGDNLVAPSPRMPWYDGPTVKEALLRFAPRAGREDGPFRMPVQGVYKFTRLGDDRRIIAGTVETGRLAVGDEVVFYPSGKRSRVKRIESFNEEPPSLLSAGESKGFTLETQVYVRPGELAAKVGEPSPEVASAFRVTLFWLSPHPMVKGKRYTLRLGAAREAAYLSEIRAVVDSSELTTEREKEVVEQYDVAECVLSTLKPVAFDLYHRVPPTGRFVIIDEYEIAGGGVILEALPISGVDSYVRAREERWRRGEVGADERAMRYGQRPYVLLVTGEEPSCLDALARRAERTLFERGWNVYYLASENLMRGLEADLVVEDREEHLRRMGEVLRLLADTGLVVITTVVGMEEEEVALLREVARPAEVLVVEVGSKLPDELLAARLREGVCEEDLVEDLARLLKDRRILLEYHL
ncbi:GTP-binding protein [Spirochaeta thermophila]|uniref:Sulfate adenylyltransferase, large subunit n=1 Tax=Winmispira thermophila (strain ATCC 49972 / DSM 6192 / RI 19.B1) TaxID=665571 RepID=E0RN88_WINT6|nr:GTP-binding protein [Spirochaeta thermophila]ADN02557.1 sulfate adenylyltransferase, large subunit [Spirochaeta thermophila DSM 6192]